MSGDKGISAFPESDNLFKWVGTIHGAAGTVSVGVGVGEGDSAESGERWEVKSRCQFCVESSHLVGHSPVSSWSPEPVALLSIRAVRRGLHLSYFQGPDGKEKNEGQLRV